jgi:hypothetical protein
LNRNPANTDDRSGSAADFAGGGRHEHHADSPVLSPDRDFGRGRHALAQACARQGTDVSCDDGRRGLFAGDAIIWADGTRSSLASPHPSVIIGNKSSVIVGQGVFVGGQGKGVVPMENPSDPRRARCPVLDGVSYCY